MQKRGDGDSEEDRNREGTEKWSDPNYVLKVVAQDLLLDQMWEKKEKLSMTSLRYGRSQCRRKSGV